MTLARQSHGVSMQMTNWSYVLWDFASFPGSQRRNCLVLELYGRSWASCQASLFPLCLLYKVPECEVLCATWHLGCVSDILLEFDYWHQAAEQKHWQRWLVMANQQILGAGKIAWGLCLVHVAKTWLLPSCCMGQFLVFQESFSLVLKIRRALIFGCRFC